MANIFISYEEQINLDSILHYSGKIDIALGNKYFYLF